MKLTIYSYKLKYTFLCTKDQFVFSSTTKYIGVCLTHSFECNSPCQAVSVLIFDLLSLNTLGPPGAVTCPCVPWEHLLHRTTNKTNYTSNMTSRLCLTSNTLTHT